MTQELLYTSAPRGLKPGSSGFCTVASTQGMAAPLASALESLSAYRHVFRPGDPQVHRNPIAYSHVRLNAGGRPYCVLSRVADYGQDYSGRTNKLAHHVALQANETPPAGPAWLLGQPTFMETSWDGQPRILPAGRTLKQSDRATLGICRHWQDMTGDGGWAGVLAESFLNDPQRSVYIIFEPGMDLLPLFGEAIELLPDDRRWDVTFSTYFTSLPRGVTCNWRCVLAGSAEANHSRRFVQALRLDLTQPMERADGGLMVEQARSGKRRLKPSPSTPPLPVPQYLEAVGAESGSGEHFSESHSESDTYSLPGGPTAPPPPPRSRQRWDDSSDAPTLRRRFKLAMAVIAAFVLLGLVAGGTYILRSRDRHGDAPADNRVASNDSPNPQVESPDPPDDQTEPSQPAMAALSSDPTNTVEDAGSAQHKQPADDIRTDGQQQPSKDTNGKGEQSKSKTTSPTTAENNSKPETPKNEPQSKTVDKDVSKAQSQPPPQNGKQLEYVKLPGSQVPEYENKTIKRFAVKSVILSTDRPQLSLFVPAFSENWTSESDGKSVTIFERDPTSNSLSKLATLILEQEQLNEGSREFQLFLDIPNGKHKNGNWKILKWCALEIEDGQHKLHYILNERLDPPINRQLIKGKLEWRLPLVIKTGTTPFRVDHVTLEVQNHTFVFHTPSSINQSKEKKTSKSEISLVDRDVTNHFCEPFDSPTSAKRKKKGLNLNLKYQTTDADKGQISLWLTKIPSTWEDAKARFKKHAQKMIGSQIESLPHTVNQQAKIVKIWYSFLTNNRKLDKTKLFEEMESLQELKGQSKLSADVIKKMKTFESTLRKLQSDAVNMKKLYEGIQSSKIVSARIYYRLRRLRKEKIPTGSTAKSAQYDVKEIEVIRFDSRQ